jgi:hypothetical protein
MSPMSDTEAAALRQIDDIPFHELAERYHPQLRGRWDDYDHCWEVRHHADGRRIAVLPLMYTAAVIIGPVHNPLNAYDDRWCYHSVSAAWEAAMRWDGTGEPYGWHRHPDTGRRRPGGDETQEYVEP